MSTPVTKNELEAALKEIDVKIVNFEGEETTAASQLTIHRAQKAELDRIYATVPTPEFLRPGYADLEQAIVTAESLSAARLQTIADLKADRAKLQAQLDAVSGSGAKGANGAGGGGAADPASGDDDETKTNYLPYVYGTLGLLGLILLGIIIFGVIRRNKSSPEQPPTMSPYGTFPQTGGSGYYSVEGGGGGSAAPSSFAYAGQGGSY